jgi:hypothetical protein
MRKTSNSLLGLCARGKLPLKLECFFFNSPIQSSPLSVLLRVPGLFSKEKCHIIGRVFRHLLDWV